MAAIYTKVEAESICKNRDTDKMYKYSDVVKLVEHHVDMQDLRCGGKLNMYPHTYSHLEVL